MADEHYTIFVTSGYGANTRRPFVSITVGDRKPIQISPDEARDLAANLQGAAEAAEQDAFLVTWFQQEFELPIEQAAQILLKYRAAREAHAHDSSHERHA